MVTKYFHDKYQQFTGTKSVWRVCQDQTKTKYDIVPWIIFLIVWKKYIFQTYQAQNLIYCNFLVAMVTHSW